MKTLRDIDWSKCKTNRFRGCDTRTELDSDGDPRVVYSGLGGTAQLAVKDIAHGGWLYELVYDRELDKLREICRQVDSFIEFELRGPSAPAVKLPVKTKAPPGCTWERNDDGSVVLCVHGEGGHFDVEFPANPQHRDAYLACAEAYGEVFGGQVVHDILVLDTSYHRCFASSFQAQIGDTIPSKGPAKIIINGS